MEQPNLFDANAAAVQAETVVLYALGDFQSRGKILAGRELALDRLRGALKRAAEKYNVAEFADETIAETLARMGAKIQRVPAFVAKHPFRITVSAETAERAALFYGEQAKAKSRIKL